jgi:peroxiredoxin
MHMPSFVKNVDAIKAKGVSDVIVTSTNDVFVLKEWLKATGAEGKVDALSDGNAQFAKAIGMDFDGSGRGLGTRTKRYSMLVEDGVVKQFNAEENPGQCTVSGGEALLKQL